MKRIVFSLLGFIILSAGLLTGCVSNPALMEEPGQKTGDAADEDLVTVGFSQLGAESDWRDANTASMQTALSEENGYRLIFDDAQQKQEKQIKAIRDFISQEVDIIVVAPVTETGWEAVLAEARDAGIPVIIVDRMIDVSDDSLYTCWVGSDFETEGVKAAEWLVNHINEQKRDDEIINVVVLQGTIGSSAEIGRTKGFDDTIAKYKNYKILEERNAEFTQANGKQVMEEFLQKYHSIDVVIAQNDNMAFGAVEALKAVGKAAGSEVIIVSFDGVKAAFEAMIAGEVNVCVECNPLHGPRVAELIRKIMNDEEVEKTQYVEEGIYPAETAERELPNRKY